MMKNVYRLSFIVLITFLFYSSFVFSEGLIYYRCHPLNDEPCEGIDLSEYAYSCEGVDRATIKSGIQTCEDLQRIGCITTMYSNVYLAGGQFYLMNDIDCGGILFDYFNFGESNKPTSTLDGRGFVIRGLRSDHGGMFEKIENAVIKNLNLENFIISTPDSAGTLAKLTNSTLIQNVNLNGFSITGGWYTARAAGGLVGVSSKTYFYNVNVLNGQIDVNIQDEIGGVLGSGDRVKMDNIFINNVFIQSSYYHNPNEIGGVVGRMMNGTLNNILVEREVSFGKMKYDIGGVVGWAQDTIINNAINLANIFPLETLSTTDGNLGVVGGIIGHASGATKIMDSNNYGDIGDNVGGYNISGIVGNAGLIHLENVFNKGNIFGKNSISGIGNVSYFSKINVAHIEDPLGVIGGVIISTNQFNKDYQKCRDLRVVNAWAWYCDYGTTICPYLNYTDCTNNSYNNYCLVGYGGLYTPREDVNWVRPTPLNNEGLPLGFSCCQDTGPIMCDSLYQSSNVSNILAQCSGVSFGTKGDGQSSENPSESHPRGSIVVKTTVDNNTVAKCESYCMDSQTLILIGGMLPFCANISESWNYQSDCINGDNICEDPCNYLNDTDCSIPSNLCGNNICNVGENYLNCPNDCPILNFVCTGAVPLNSVMYFDDNVGLTVNTSITLSQTNTVKKCEYYCPVGFHQGLAGTVDENKCLVSECSPIANGVCPVYCTSLNDADCVGGVCVGSFSNAAVIPFDNNGFLGVLDSVLVSGDTVRKCEWLCEEDFVKGLGLDENRCMNEFGYSCVAPLDGNAVLYSGDDVGSVSYYEHFGVLSLSDSSRKCEYFCNPGFDLVLNERLQRCVPRGLDLGVCGDANRVYYMGEAFPGGDSFCENGFGLYTGEVVLPNHVGPSNSWKCVGVDGNSWCNAFRSESSIFDVNAILDLNVSYRNGELLVSVKCSKSTVAVLRLFGEDSEISINPVTISCGPYLTTESFTPLSEVSQGKIYSVNASILVASSDCVVCSKTDFFNFTKTREDTVPDNSIILTLFVLLGTLFLFKATKRD